VSQAGDVLLVETVHKTGLDQAASAASAPWRKARREAGKKTYGHHPLMGFVDHGCGGSG
jgi:hypothetical protein